VKYSERHVGVKIVGAILVFLLAVPIIVLVGVSVNPGVEQVFPPTGFSLRWYRNLANRDGLLSAVQVTLWLAMISSMINVVVALFAGLAIERFRFPGRDLVLTLLLSPLIIPQVVVGLAFLITLSSLGIFDSLFSLTILHSTITLPFTTRVVVSTLVQSSRSLEEAAQSLGASPAKAFFLISLPLIKPGIITAGIFTFVTSFENFTATQFLVWDRTTLPVEIYTYVQTESDPTAAAVSGIIVLTVIAFVIVFNRFIATHMFSARRET